MITQEEWISRSKITHNNFYDYSLVEFINYKLPVTIVCPVHGRYNQNLKEHSRGSRCPLCAKESRKLLTTSTTKDFITKAKLVHGAKYNYDKVNYISAKQFIIITCNVHGEFLQKPSTHIKGSGCLRCSLSKKRPNRNSNTNKFIESAQKIHGNKYDYSKVNYSCNRDNVIIICHIHGEFSQKANSHLNGYGCKECGKDIIRSLMKERQVINKLNLIKDFTKVHGDRYDYSEFKYIDCKKTKSTIICKQHGKFLQTYYSHKKGSGCPSCNTMSKAQKDLLNYLTNIYDGIILYNYYPSWLEGKELDIYIPEFKLAIEYNGVIYHHSGIEEKDCYGLNRYSVNSDYHLNKYQSCKTNRY